MSKLDGTWRKLPNLDVARSHSPVVPYNGKLYVFGGGGPEFQSQNGTVAYDLKSKKWEKCADMPTKRSGTAAFLVNGKIYVLGGGFKKPDGNFQFLTTVEGYDPRTNSWQTYPDLIQPHDYPAAAVDGNNIYILGGHHPEACLGGPKTDPGFSFSERWAPGEDSWTQIADMPTPRFAAAAVTRNGKILTCGGVAFRPEGFNNFDFFETYNPVTNTWQEEAALKLPWPAAGHGLCEADGALFFFGGYSTDNIHNRASVLLQGETEWRALPPMPMPRAAMGVAVVDKTIYLVGGWADDGRTPMQSVVAYNWED